MSRLITSIVVGVALSRTASADTLPVPTPQFPTIQSAIDGASPGDVVIVAPGTYSERLDFGGKAIAVTSSDGPAATVLDGASGGNVVRFSQGEGRGSILSGFTITHGSASNGGGIRCQSASPTIRNNVIAENVVSSGGAGIWCRGGEPLIEGNVVRGNHAAGDGGGMTLIECAAVVRSNLFMGNSAGNGHGAGIVMDSSSPVIVNNTFYGNTAFLFGGGLSAVSGSNPTVVNCIFWNDSPDEIAASSSSGIFVSHCDVLGGASGSGNISVDPLFASPSTGDFHIPLGSPCRDAGDTGHPQIGTLDIDRQPRIAGTGVDIGADEYAEPTLHPVADGGGSQAVDEGDAVHLDGLASSDPYGLALTFLWSQIAGPPVTLDDASYATPSFVAPTVALGGATITFQLTVSDGISDSDPATVDVTVRNVNHAPIASAGEDQVVAEGAVVVLDGSSSADLDGDATTFAWIQTLGPPVVLIGADGSHASFTAPPVGMMSVIFTFELEVGDGIATSSDEVTIVVENVDHPPVADAGPDQTKAEGALTTLNGAGSSDPDGDPLVYAWLQVAGPAVALVGSTTATPTFVAPQVGSGGTSLVFELVVSDGVESSSTDSVTIHVLDVNSPPLCTAATPSQSMLWPPNHKFVLIRILGVTDPDQQAVTITITSVTQDEPVSGLGDGDTAPDAVLQGSSVLIRAERAGAGNGRVYTIHFQASDGQGGISTGSVQVKVPHDMGHGGSAIDDGQIYVST